MSRVCPTCPYKWVIAQRISMRTHLKRKEVDDVLGGKDSWANVDVVDGESMLMLMSSASWACPFHFTSRTGGTKESERGTNERTKWERKEEKRKIKTRTEKADPSYLPCMR
jgi:hypothetical protein